MLAVTLCNFWKLIGYGGYDELRIQIIQAGSGKEKLKQIGIGIDTIKGAPNFKGAAMLLACLGHVSIIHS
jgi:hypothetical protein